MLGFLDVGWNHSFEKQFVPGLLFLQSLAIYIFTKKPLTSFNAAK